MSFRLDRQVSKRFSPFISSLRRRQMSSFRVIEHIVRSQHSRERWAATELGHENRLRLHVKQYIPLSNTSPKPGDVTIIGAVANAFPKELHEPLWDDLYEKLLRRGHKIRSIWIADPVNTGQSGVLNETILGPDPSWWDHARDLLYLINQFQDGMPHPLIGIGHSMGAGHLAHLALLHPRLLHAIVLMDPVIRKDNVGLPYAIASIGRRDLWPSRAAAAEKMRVNKAFKKWDSRVLDKYIEYGLRELPTELYPELSADSDPRDPPVTLQTTKAQEQYNYMKAAYEDDRLLLNEGDLWREFYPEDVDLDWSFTRGENKILHRRLPELRPSVLYIAGEQSDVSTPDLRRMRVDITGTGVGGSGGAAKGRVQGEVLDCGHLVPFERTKECAEVCATFIDHELQRWSAEERNRKQRWERLSRRERVDINDLWRQHIDQVKQRKGTKL